MKSKKALLVFVAGLSVFFILGIYSYSQMAEIKPKMMLIYAIVGVVGLGGIFIAIKKIKEEKEGQPTEDEFSTQVKYKSGFYAYIASMYMWLFIFLFRGLFPDAETMVGGGILLSGLIGFIVRIFVKRSFNEKSN